MKAFVIRLKNIDDSEILANDCVESGIQHNLVIEKYDGIYGVENIEKTTNFFKISPFKTKMKKNRLGIKGCFLSHFSLWKLSVELSEPIVIFEHDAVLLQELPTNITNKFEDILLLDPFNKFSKSYKIDHEKSKLVDQSVIEYRTDKPKLKYGLQHEYPKGLQAYIIKPEGALKLIKHVELMGYLPADMQCNKGIVKLYTVTQGIASVNQRFYDNKELMNNMSTTQKKW